jgi:hypothetical protein
MDLPPDKLKIVTMLPDEKKIQFLNSLAAVSEKNPPEYYIRALSTYVEGISNQKSRKPKLTTSESSTQLIKNLEVSLRTNLISWVHKYLDAPLNGLDILILYLENSLSLMREYEQYDGELYPSHGNLSRNVSLGEDEVCALRPVVSVEKRGQLARRDPSSKNS